MASSLWQCNHIGSTNADFFFGGGVLNSDDSAQWQRSLNPFKLLPLGIILPDILFHLTGFMSVRCWWPVGGLSLSCIAHLWHYWGWAIQRINEWMDGFHICEWIQFHLHHFQIFSILLHTPRGSLCTTSAILWESLKYNVNGHLEIKLIAREI